MRKYLYYKLLKEPPDFAYVNYEGFTGEKILHQTNIL